jgi:ribose 5-phosphate isomerase B
MKIAIGNDHIGYDLKEHIKGYLAQQGHDVVDFGTDGPKRVDYPLFAEKVANAVVLGDCERGILICGTGVGICIAANKIKGVRAAVCSEPYSARLTRLHNDANVITFGARVVGLSIAEMITDEFIGNDYEGGRHQHRVDMITALEEGKTLNHKGGKTCTG